MKILALEHENPSASAKDFQEHLKSEAAVLWKLQQNGVVREAYFTLENHSAVLVLESNSTAEAEMALAALPLVRAGLIRFELLTLTPYDGYARLFSDSGLESGEEI